MRRSIKAIIGIGISAAILGSCISFAEDEIMFEEVTQAGPAQQKETETDSDHDSDSSWDDVSSEDFDAVTQELLREIQKMEEEKGQLEEKNTTLTEENEKLEKQLKTTKKNLNKKKKKVQELEKENEELKSEIEKQNSEIAEIRKAKNETDVIEELTQDMIEQLQKNLNARGYNCGAEDGTMGIGTLKAIRHFKVDHDLPLTDAITQSLINAINATALLPTATPIPTAVPTVILPTATPIPTQTPSGPTQEQYNALNAAVSLLNAMPYSYGSLINQLILDGYSENAAVYAANNCRANWYEQAVLMAEYYLQNAVLDYDDLYQQLSFDQFSPDEIEYALDALGIEDDIILDDDDIIYDDDDIDDIDDIIMNDDEQAY